ncbi:MAG: hypothetical protein IT195_01215 [Microthrixaceae bacterium]|nr:hypothetical protein [Microthrixaceae bacterium]
MWWTWLHVVGWATYIGGALVMEFVWRPAQNAMPQSQIAVACRWMGRRYRWVAAVSLAVLAVSGVGLVVSSDRTLSLSSSWGRTVWALVVVWVALAATLGAIAFYGHPSLHTRMRADLSEEERRDAREQVRRAIGRMDVLLRIDLALALVAGLLGAGLHSGGIL